MSAAWALQRLVLADADAERIVPGGFTTLLAATSLTVQVRDAHGDLAAHLTLSLDAAHALQQVLADMLEDVEEESREDAITGRAGDCCEQRYGQPCWICGWTGTNGALGRAS